MSLSEEPAEASDIIVGTVLSAFTTARIADGNVPAPRSDAVKRDAQGYQSGLGISTVGHQSLSYRAEMIYSGEAVVDYYQFVLGSPTAETYTPSETGSVIEVGKNFVTVITGISYGPVSLTVEILEHEPAFNENQTEWEVVEEATVKATEAFHVITLGGEKLPDFDRLPIRGLHRFRVSGRGRDEHGGLAVEEPTEQYFVQVWKVARPHGMVRLHKSDSAWDQQIVEHPTPNWWDPDPAADASLYLKYGYEQMAEWAKEEAIRWGGRPPSEKLRLCPEAIDLAGHDRALADAITRARPPKLRDITVWALRRAFATARIVDQDGLHLLQSTFQSLRDAAQADGGSYDALIADLRKAYFPKLMPADKYERWI